MVTTTDYLLVILFCYGFFLFLDRFFKSCSMYPYIAFLNNTGIEVNILNINWKTTALNRALVKFRTKRRLALAYWFDVGVYTSLILLPLTIILLIYALVQLFWSKQLHDKDLVVIQPIIPGVTYPIDELGYYVIALALSSFVHEFGHALAAAVDDVHIYQVGLKLYFIIPLAYVLISNEQLNTIAYWKRLRILCAGVWHNLIFALFSYVLLLALPFALNVFFRQNQGVFVTNLSANSPLVSHDRAVNSLEAGDVIVKLNGIVVVDEGTWMEGLLKSVKVSPNFCVHADVLHDLDESVHVTHGSNGEIKCCDPTKRDLYCFEHLENGIAELPAHMCLPMRKIVENSPVTCVDDSYCPTGTHCMRPILKNNTYLVVINRLDKTPVIYTGHPGNVFRTVSISSFLPRNKLFNPIFADRAQLLLNYLIVFSLGLAIVNVVPCWFLDGQHIVNVLVQVVLVRSSWTSLSKQVLSLSLTITGSLLLGVCVIGALWVRGWN